ncbi:MAG: acyl-CoA dehydrogenase family protein [Candidatus Thermoplasmatota archaeon]
MASRRPPRIVTMALDFSFSEEQELFRQTVREFVDEEIRPMMPRGFVEGHEFPWAIVRKIQKQGLMGVPIPREYGGAGMGEVGYCIMIEELAHLDASVATIVGAHTGICVQPLYLFGTEAQRETFVRPLSDGRAIGAFALTEPQAGSDAANIQTAAIKDGNEWVLSGTKTFVTNGDIADYLMVSAVTDPALGARRRHDVHRGEQARGFQGRQRGGQDGHPPLNDRGDPPRRSPRARREHPGQGR